MTGSGQAVTCEERRYTTKIELLIASGFLTNKEASRDTERRFGNIEKHLLALLTTTLTSHLSDDQTILRQL